MDTGTLYKGSTVKKEKKNQNTKRDIMATVRRNGKDKKFYQLGWGWRAAGKTRLSKTQRHTHFSIHLKYMYKVEGQKQVGKKLQHITEQSS